MPSKVTVTASEQGSLEGWLKTPGAPDIGSEPEDQKAKQNEGDQGATPNGGTETKSPEGEALKGDDVDNEDNMTSKSSNLKQPPEKLLQNLCPENKGLVAVTGFAPEEVADAALVTPGKTADGDFLHQVHPPTKTPTITIAPLPNKDARDYQSFDRKFAIHVTNKSLQNLMHHVSMGHDLRFTRDGSRTLNKLIKQLLIYIYRAAQTYWKQYYNKKLINKDADLMMDSTSMPDLNMWVMEFLKTGTFKYPIVIHM